MNEEFNKEFLKENTVKIKQNAEKYEIERKERIKQQIKEHMNRVKYDFNYGCICCQFYCRNKSQFKIHLISDKHERNYEKHFKKEK